MGIPNSAGGFKTVVKPPEALRIQCSKMVKILVKCLLDNLKVIAVLRLKTNLTSCFGTKSSLIWSFNFPCTVTFKQYDWVMWLISADILSCKFWYVVVRYGKVVLSWTYSCIYSASQSDLYVWRLIFMYPKEAILTLQLVAI